MYESESFISNQIVFFYRSDKTQISNRLFRRQLNVDQSTTNYSELYVVMAFRDC